MKLPSLLRNILIHWGVWRVVRDPYSLFPPSRKIVACVLRTISWRIRAEEYYRRHSSHPPFGDDIDSNRIVPSTMFDLEDTAGRLEDDREEALAIEMDIRDEAVVEAFLSDRQEAVATARNTERGETPAPLYGLSGSLQEGEDLTQTVIDLLRDFFARDTG